MYYDELADTLHRPACPALLAGFLNSGAALPIALLTVAGLIVLEALSDDGDEEQTGDLAVNRTALEPYRLEDQSSYKGEPIFNGTCNHYPDLEGYHSYQDTDELTGQSKEQASMLSYKPYRDPIREMNGLDGSNSTVQAVTETADSTVYPYKEDSLIGETAEETVIDEEAIKKELIRQAMSELGKRSAAKRARKG